MWKRKRRRRTRCVSGKAEEKKKRGGIPSFPALHLTGTGTFCLPTRLQSSNLGHTFNLPFFHTSLRFRAVNPSRASRHSSDSRGHLHGNRLTLPPPLIPVRLLRSGLNTSPRPFPPPPLPTPRLLPRFLFFFCSVAFNSSRPLCAARLMAPRWVTVRGRKAEAEEEGKTGGDRDSRIPGV